LGDFPNTRCLLSWLPRARARHYHEKTEGMLTREINLLLICDSFAVLITSHFSSTNQKYIPQENFEVKKYSFYIKIYIQTRSHSSQGVERNFNYWAQ